MSRATPEQQAEINRLGRAQYGFCGCGRARSVLAEYCPCCGHYLRTVIRCPECTDG